MSIIIYSETITTCLWVCVTVYHKETKQNKTTTTTTTTKKKKERKWEWGLSPHDKNVCTNERFQKMELLEELRYFDV